MRSGMRKDTQIYFINRMKRINKMRSIEEQGYKAFGPLKNRYERFKASRLPEYINHQRAFYAGWLRASNDFMNNIQVCPLCGCALKEVGNEGYRRCTEFLGACPYFDNGKIQVT